MMPKQERWQLAGTAPEIYERHLVPAIFGPWAPVLVTLASPQPGESLLDVACGTGVVARLAARHVGTSGRVTGLDLNPGMLAVARASLPVTEPVVEWREANVEAMPFPDATFDVVICQLGLQYFPNRHVAIREMHRVLAPGGRLALLVWRSLQHCPGYAALTDVLDRHIGPEAGNIMRAPFSLGDREELRTALSEGAFRDVVIRLSVGMVRFPSVEKFVQYQVAGSPLSGPVGQADDSARDALTEDLTTALRPYVDDEASRSLLKPISPPLVSRVTNVLPSYAVLPTLLLDLPGTRRWGQAGVSPEGFTPLQ